ncbi:MAG: hypothetical protein M1839_003721 [Geoglossum umbratile]|nr:MAG: hypothetical protein M1839_003721 [Geoglossum umbratile]
MATIPTTAVKIKQLTAAVCSVAEELQTFLGGVTESSSSRHKDLRRLRTILENLSAISRKLAIHASESLSLSSSGDGQATEGHHDDGSDDNDNDDMFLEFVSMLNGCKTDLESLQTVVEKISSVSCHIPGCCFGQRARLYFNRKNIAESARKLERQRASLQLALVIVCRDVKHQKTLQAIEARIAALTDKKARSQQTKLSPPDNGYVSDDELTKTSSHIDAEPEAELCSVKPSVKPSVREAAEEVDGKSVQRGEAVCVLVREEGLVEGGERDEERDEQGEAEGEEIEDNNSNSDHNADESPELTLEKEATQHPLPPSPPPSLPPSPSHASLPPPDLPPPDLDPPLKTLHHALPTCESDCPPLLPAPSNWRLSTSTDRDSGGSNYYYYPSYWTCCACSGGPYSGSCLVDCSVCGHRECVHCVEF